MDTTLFSQEPQTLLAMVIDHQHHENDDCDNDFDENYDCADKHDDETVHYIDTDYAVKATSQSEIS